jgi:hypothetical protein
MLVDFLVERDCGGPELADRICGKVATLAVSAHVAAASEGETSTAWPDQRFETSPLPGTRSCYQGSA